MDRKVILIAGLVMLIGLAFIGYQQLAAPPIMHGKVYNPPEPAPDFTLESDNGPVTLIDLRGKYVLLYFGYTYCPDVCPTTLSFLRRAINELGKNAEGVQVIFISVDPQRDTPERLGKYVRVFNPEFLGVTSSEEEIAQVTEAYDIHYHVNQIDQADLNYTVDHSSVITVIDPAGFLRLVWSHDVEVADIVADLNYLLMEP